MLSLFMAYQETFIIKLLITLALVTFPFWGASMSVHVRSVVVPIRKGLGTALTPSAFIQARLFKVLVKYMLFHGGPTCRSFGTIGSISRIRTRTGE